MYLLYNTSGNLHISLHVKKEFLHYSLGQKKIAANKNNLFNVVYSVQREIKLAFQLNSALEAQSKLGGDDLVPFYGLLDGGREGELFAELEDYFYYAQIRR